MNATAWHGQYVAGFQAHVGGCRETIGINRLVLLALNLARRAVSAEVQMPDLGALDLQDQHVMVVVVGSQTRLTWRSDVGVDLYWEVQLDLDRAGQRTDSPDVFLDAVQHDRVALGEVVVDTDNIEAAVREQEVLGTLFVSSLDQPHRRWLEAKQLQQLVDRRRSAQQTIEIAWAASLDVVMGCRPDLVEKGFDGQRLKQPGERELDANARRAFPHQSCSPPSSASAFQVPGTIGIVGPPPKSLPSSVIKPAACVTVALPTVPAKPNRPPP